MSKNPTQATPASLTARAVDRAEENRQQAQAELDAFVAARVRGGLEHRAAVRLATKEIRPTVEAAFAPY